MQIIEDIFGHMEETTCETWVEIGG